MGFINRLLYEDWRYAEVVIAVARDITRHV
jgi:hypothetical protein